MKVGDLRALYDSISLGNVSAFCCSSIAINRVAAEAEVAANFRQN